MQVTTIEQSRKLLELGLEPKTADMRYGTHEGEVDKLPKVGYSETLIGFIPAWSLDKLLGLIPVPYQMTRREDGKVQLMLFTVLRKDYYDNELEAVYAMLVWLLENNLLDKTKLKNYGT